MDGVNITKQNRVLVTGGTKSDVAPMACFAMNIKETNGHLFDKLIIFHDGINANDQKLINSIFPTEFILYKPNFKSANDVVLTYFSKMVFCKYECFRLLEKYDTVVWSDYDVVIYDKLDEICEYNGKPLKGVINAGKLREEFYKEITNKEIEKYDLSVGAFSTPLIVMFNSMQNYMGAYEFCNRKTSEYSEDIYLPEQCIMALALQEYNIEVEELDPKVYVCIPKDFNFQEYVKIFHAAGPVKFWNGLHNDVWARNYDEWIAMGGTKYNDFHKKMKNTLSLIKTRIKGGRSKELWSEDD